MILLFDQETLTDRDAGTFGDCTRACVRTLAQDAMPDLPHPIAEDGDWNMAFYEALEGRYGLALHYQPIRGGKDYSFLPRVVGAGGPTVRTEATGGTHMVIYDRIALRMLHDPHPSRAGLTAIEGFYWLTKVEVPA